MNKLSCFLFDFDGTLVDTSSANTIAYKKAFESVGINFDESLYKAHFGLRFDDMCRIIAPSATDEQKTSVQKAKEIFYKENLDLVKVNDGIIGLLTAIHRHYKTALVSTARKVNIMNVLSYYSIDTSLFDLIISGEDVANAKPDPECYALAMEQLGAKPEECCVFEDSTTGVEAATRAGAKIIKVQL